MPNSLGKYTFIDAAIKVIKKEKRPMGAKEVIDESLRLGLIKTYGKTPENTLTAILNGIVKEGGGYKGHKVIKVAKGAFSIEA